LVMHKSYVLHHVYSLLPRAVRHFHKHTVVFLAPLCPSQQPSSP